jgi:hypothetical protein
MAFLPGMELRRAMAMRIAGKNEPTGKGYNAALSELMTRDGLDDKQSFDAVLWFSEPPHRMQILREMQRNMTPGQLAWYNSPSLARGRVRSIAIERGLEGRAVKPQGDAVEARSNRVKDFEGGNEHLREHGAPYVHPGDRGIKRSRRHRAR